MREKARSSKDATIRGRTRSLSGCTITQLVDMTDAAIPAEGVGKKYWSCKCTLHLHLTLDDASRYLANCSRELQLSRWFSY